MRGVAYAVATVSVLLGASGISGGCNSSTSTPTWDCDHYCSKLQAAGCPDDQNPIARAMCVPNCQTVLDSPICQAEWRAVFDCYATATFNCTVSLTMDCQSQGDAYYACIDAVEDAGSDAGAVIPQGCDEVIPVNQRCSTQCYNWTTELRFICGTGPAAYTIGTCAHDYSITTMDMGAIYVDFYSKDTLEWEGAVQRHVDGKVVCAGTFPSIEPCGSDPPPPCSTDGGTSDQ